MTHVHACPVENCGARFHTESELFQHMEEQSHDATLTRKIHQLLLEISVLAQEAAYPNNNPLDWDLPVDADTMLLNDSTEDSESEMEVEETTALLRDQTQESHSPEEEWTDDNEDDPLKVLHLSSVSKYRYNYFTDDIFVE
jgi:hypothetical protein